MNKSNSFILLANDYTIQAGHAEIHTLAIYLSRSGRLVITLEKLPDNSRWYALSRELAKWKYQDVDRIACMYTWETRGQMYSIIDLMAEAGYMDFSGASGLASSVDKHLLSGDYTLVYAAW